MIQEKKKKKKNKNLMIDHWIKKAIYIYNIAFTGNLDQSIKDIFICNSNKNIPIDEIGVISIILIL